MIPADLDEVLTDAGTQLQALRAILARAATSPGAADPDSPAARALDQAHQLATAASDALADASLLLADRCTPDVAITVPPSAHERAMAMATAHLDGVEHDDGYALLSATITELLADGGLPMREVASLLAAQARLAATLALHHTGTVPAAMADLRASVYAHHQAG